MRRRKKMLEDLDRNIRDHLERETQDLIDRGMPPAEAHYAVLRKFGNVTRFEGRDAGSLEHGLARAMGAGCSLRHSLCYGEVRD